MGLIIIQEINSDSLNEWIEYRKLIKKPLNEIAIEKVKSRLLKYSAEDQKVMIDRSIENNWRGLFDIKKEDDSPGFIESHTDRSWADNLPTKG